MLWIADWEVMGFNPIRVMCDFSSLTDSSLRWECYAYGSSWKAGTTQPSFIHITYLSLRVLLNQHQFLGLVGTEIIMTVINIVFRKGHSRQYPVHVEPSINTPKSLGTTTSTRIVVSFGEVSLLVVHSTSASTYFLSTSDRMDIGHS